MQKQGDSGNFFKTLKFCNSRTLPDEIAAAKALLVQTIYRENGIEGMLKICEHKKSAKSFITQSFGIYMSVRENIIL
ncbi:MAG: hypothetical protein LUH15_18205 [Tannerellaceae bacterium]|nr:hypothetical protein [Tannerellaceae bacterium]